MDFLLFFLTFQTLDARGKAASILKKYMHEWYKYGEETVLQAISKIINFKCITLQLIENKP